MKNITATLKNFFQKLKLPTLNLRLPHLQFERATLWAFILIAVFTLGNLALIVFLFLPTFQAFNVLGTSVQNAQENLLSARQLREESPEVLEKRLAGIATQIQRGQRMLLDRSDLQSIATSVYQGANLSGIALTEFSISGGPEDASILKIMTTPTFTLTPTRGAVKPTTKPILPTRTPTGTLTANLKTPTSKTPTETPTLAITLYQVRRLHLQAQGTTQRLVNFMARLNALGLDGASINTLDMQGKPDWATLTLDLNLFVDPQVPAQNPMAKPVLQAATTPRPATIADAPLPPGTPTPNIIVLPFGSAAKLPAAKPTQANLYLYYAKPGDTLFTLATRFHVTAQEIVNQNALTHFELTAGQKLLIPVR